VQLERKKTETEVPVVTPNRARRRAIAVEKPDPALTEQQLEIQSRQEAELAKFYPYLLWRTFMDLKFLHVT